MSILLDRYTNRPSKVIYNVIDTYLQIQVESQQYGQRHIDRLVFSDGLNDQLPRLDINRLKFKGLKTIPSSQ